VIIKNTAIPATISKKYPLSGIVLEIIDSNIFLANIGAHRRIPNTIPVLLSPSSKSNFAFGFSSVFSSFLIPESFFSYTSPFFN